MTDDDVPRRARAALSASRIFGGLGIGALDHLVAAGSLIKLEPGEPLVLRGDEGDAAFVMLEGEIEVRAMARDGREVRIAAHRASSLIGEMATLDGSPRSADMIASRRSQLWRLPRAAVLDTLRANPDVAIALLIELTGRLRAANQALELASRRTLEGQLAAVLIGEVNRAGLVSLPQTELARRTGFSREKINRKLHAWAAKGWVAVERSGVVVKQRAPLEAIAQ